MENTTQNSYHTHISSKHNALELKLDEVWRYRDLILLFTKRNFVVRYKQTILGPAWILLNPLFSSIIYAIVFGGIAKIGTEGIPTILFYLCSNAIWLFFATCVTTNARTFTENANVFGKVYFPRLTMPISNMLSAGIHFCVQMLMVLGFLGFYLVQGGASQLGSLAADPGGAAAFGNAGSGLRHYRLQPDHQVPGSGDSGGLCHAAVDVCYARCLPPVYPGAWLDPHDFADQPGNGPGGILPLCHFGSGQHPAWSAGTELGHYHWGNADWHCDF